MEIHELRTGFTDWTEVSKAEWIESERAAGFRPRMAGDDPRYPGTCATGGFDSADGVSGRVRTGGPHGR